MTPQAQGLLWTFLLASSCALARAEAPVTFTRHIAPVLFEHCAPCHRPGQSAPFSLLSYGDAKKHSADIAKVTRSGYMPPWLPARGFGDFVGERHLNASELHLIQTWVDSGAPEGDPKDLPAPPRFPEGWQLGVPDLVLEMPETYLLAAEGKDLYRNFVIPAPLRESRFVRAFEFQPRNRAVHHVRIKFDATRQSRRLDEQDAEPGFPGMRTPGRFPPGHMTTWVPGQKPMPVAEGLQWALEKDADIVLELHLQRTGRPENIRPQIAFYFTNAAPTKSSFLVGLSSQLIDIPAGATNYVIERHLQLPVEARALRILPHMHYLGREIEAYATLPNGTKQSLLRISNWDFNWQGEFQYREPVALPAGSTLTMRARYDNSAANPRNPNHPPRRVVYGPQSTDEMAELWVQVLVKSAADLAALQKAHKNLNDRETVAFYEGELRENPNNAAMHNALGKVLGPMGRLEEAVSHFRTAIELSPDLVEARYYLGLSLLTMRDLAGAQREFEAALKYDPSYGKAHNGLGLVAIRLNRPDEAEKHFRRALELNPDDPAALSSLQKLGRRP